MGRILIIFLGGGIGACLRAILLAELASWGASSVLLANLLGSFTLGVVFVLADEVGLLSASTRLFLAVGVLGGFTTFSTFGWGADLLVAQGTPGAAFQYLTASVGGGVAAVIGGLMAGRAVARTIERGIAVRPRRKPAGSAIDSIEAEDRETSA